MAEIFELINDIALSYDGDLILDENDDLRIISSIEWFKREINKILKTKLGEWKSDPNIGMDLENFHGQANNRNVAINIKKEIQRALTLDNFQFPGQFEIQVIPISTSEITIYIIYNILGDNYNIVKLMYDLNNGILQSTYDELESEINYAKNYKKEQKNLYLKALMR